MPLYELLLDLHMIKTCTVKIAFVPSSSYISLVIHICWKVDKLPNIEPPIHTEYFLSGEAITFLIRNAFVMWKS